MIDYESRSVMTPTEFHLFVELIKMTEKYERCNPDVGMGPSTLTIAKEIADKCPRGVCKYDLDRAVAEASRVRLW